VAKKLIALNSHRGFVGASQRSELRSRASCSA
jgi:hypothetical protein